MEDVEGRDQFISAIDVSRETIRKLDVFEVLLKKWNPAINLVGKSTLEHLWARHFLDSAQIFTISKHKSGHWVDIGTGGGFPGLVVAIMAAEKAPDLRFTFVESDRRKATFLQAAVREVDLKAAVLTERVENLNTLAADIISVRALASLDKLLGYAETHLKPDGQAIFLKGENFRKELREALEKWSFQSDEYASLTDKAAVILSIGDIKRV
ncbi:MAG: 16S rRNA (guanine(527)-N(7))-methyltransferase RsmG [Paracoccaceae bacterium]